MNPLFTSIKEKAKYIACLAVALLWGSGVFAQASFTVSDNTLYLCGGTTASVQFTNTSTLPNGATYLWNFGNGTPGSSQTNPTQVYTYAGNFTVTLQIMQGGIPVSTATQNITVETPSVSFTVAPPAGCEQQTVFQFTNQPIVGDSFVWNFGDGVLLSDVNNPTHVYNNFNPNTNVSVLVYVDGFANACASAIVPVNVQPKPDAIATANSTVVCDPNESINFIQTSTNAVSHFWNFGDGQTSALSAPSHIYGSYGTYNVTYIATGSSGCTDTTSFTIDITNGIIPDVTASVDTGCSPLAVTFNCTNVTNAQQYVWDFGDGTAPVTTNVPTVNHVFVNGTQSVVSYTVSLTTVFGVGSSCNSSVTLNDFITVNPQPVSAFTVGSPSACVLAPVSFTNTSTNAVSYAWDLGNGTTSTDENPTATYNASGNYNVSLITTNSYGCTDTATVVNAVNIIHVMADFNATNTSGCTVNAQFINYTQGATSFNWIFGDGTTSTQANPTHYYNTPGAYDVTLIASNGSCVDTLVINDFINVNYLTPSYTTPTIPFAGCVGIASTFQANNSEAISYLWNFGDGNTGTGPNPTHVYEQPGTYTISLITMTVDSCQELISDFANIEVFGGEPEVSTINQSCSAPYNVAFNTPNNGISYAWNFGDGSPISNLQNPTHSYAEDGYYNVSLTIITPSGCLNTYNGFNQLALFPFAAGAASDCGAGPGFGLVQSAFRPIPEDSVTVQWFFSDGQTSTETNPVMVFDTVAFPNPTYTAIITNQFGCVDTVTAEICADSPPAIPQPIGYEFPPDSTNTDSTFTISACAPYQLTFNNQFLYADSVIWHFGDGTTSTDFSPTHEFGSAGNYIVYTEVWYDNYNSYDEVYQPYIYDIGGHTPTISVSQQNFCDSIVVLFTGNSPDAVSWLWTMGNGDIETAQSFTYVYNSTDQTYHVQLTTIDAEGCPGSATSSVYSPITAPEFNFQTILCNAPLNIAHNLDSAFTYLWSFGDSTTSTDMFPVHQYANPGTYNLSLHITDGLGCPHDYVLDPVSVYLPTANFTASTHGGCAPLTVDFNSLSSNFTPGNTHYWFMDNLAVINNNGTTTTSYTFTQPGDYAVKLQVFNVDGQNCSGTFIDTIHVYGATADFTYTQNKSCFQPDIDVQFADSSDNAVSWHWDFGDGNTSTLQNPLHTFTYMPTDDITLAIVDIHGCADTISKPNISLFSASYTLNNNTVCGYTPINFSLTANGTNYTTVWDFGDGSATVTGDSVSHVYAIDGTYNAIAYVTSADGCADTVVNQVTIVQPVTSFFSNSSVTCAPSNVIFNNISNAPVGSTYIWDFGDGTIITNNNPMVAQTYITPGVYDVSLTIITPQGCTADTTYNDYVTVLGPVANFFVSNTSGCETLPVDFINLSTNVDHWVWYFGDGTADSTNFSVSHAFDIAGTYLSTIVVYDSVGCSSSMTLQNPIIISNMPNADVVVDYPSGCAPYLPQFYNNSTEATTYTWTFGDGTFSFDSLPQHTYNNPGSYEIMLVVGNGTGCQDTSWASVLVNAPPVADFTMAVIDSSCAGITIGYTNTSQTDSVANFKWVLSYDNPYATTTPPNFLVDSSGTYTAWLTVINTYTGCMDTISHSLTITVPAKPSGTLATADTIGCGQVVANFNFNYQDANSMFVDYGDGTTDTVFNPQHTYSQPGTYNPYVILYNQYGCTDTLYSNPVTVIPVPVAAFAADNIAGCSGMVVNFTNNSTGLLNPTYAWDLGNGQTSTLDAPQGVAYTNPGGYTVSLIVTNTFGCADTLVQSNYIVIADTLPPAETAMRRVTVISETKVKIEWAASTAFDFGSYDIYRYDGTTYQLISTINNINQTEFTDNNGLATLTNSYCYKVGVTDQCGYTKGIDSVTAHCTMDATAYLLPSTDRLIKWNPYGGCTVDYYEIYRTQGNGWADTTAAFLIGTVPGNVTGYLDQDKICPREYKYRIRAVSLCGGTLYSMSDTATSPLPKIDYTTLPANVTRTTVVDNQFTRTEWKAPYFPELVSYYTIFRSADSVSYQSIGQITGPFTSADTLQAYDDWDASIQTIKYYYRIETNSVCNDKSYTGKTGDNIVLQANIDHAAYEVKLEWTPYMSWGANQVDHYIIEWQDEAGVWHILELPPNMYQNNEIPGNAPTSYTAPY
jgi:PKD repeat protein